MRVLVVCDEELTAICVWSTVCHGHNPTLGVFESINNLVRKFAVWCRVYAFATLACASWISTLCDTQIRTL